MPDSFFAVSKPRKRKRTTSGHDGNSGGARTSKKFARKDGKPGGAVSVKGIQKKKGKKDEELDSDQTNEEDGGIDDLDLRHESDSGQGGSGDEDENETPAEKRLRLAQLYLDSVKEGLGTAHYSKLFTKRSKVSLQRMANMTPLRLTRNLYLRD
jgi:ribosomal RNA-processing protein 9